MKIYFTASTTNDGKYRKNYKAIISLLNKSKSKVISGEQIINFELLKLDKKMPQREIFLREKKSIDEADCIIAEVSYPSLGVGGEVVYALINNKPVLGLVYENNEDKISPMISGNPSDNFFLEYYNLDKLHYIIKDFLSYVKNSRKRIGKLIVVDGGNGSGKTTQGELIISFLKKHQLKAKYFHFPQYYNSFHGKTVTRFLNGEFGNIDQVSPYLSSLAYAVDRATAKREMEDFLNKGGYVVSDRYVTSSMAHQGAKFKDDKNKKEFLKWIYELEYKVHRVPKEDIVIYLYVPWKIGLKLTGKRGKKDIEEKDLKHWIMAEKMYLEFAKKYKHWVKIDCVKNGKLLSPKVIHELIISTLHKKNIL